MLEKLCKHCATRSYSADTFGPWPCPSCGADLTREPAETPDQPWAPITKEEGEVSYTPGPWTMEHEIDEDQLHTWWIKAGPHGLNPAKCWNPANAQLIAVAPEMYEALIRVRNAYADKSSCSLCDYHSDAMDIAWDSVRNVIAKAEGE